ncbi:NADPH:quinone oxidoreductase family protein [Rhodococcus sp. IEGM 1366]|uniref:NADPH:quinone oxidoreductase family protein n=1 Tax=Rhodococcus sp. IEGM 1366 TaxID=3082223 RepID=UPI002955908F|nr:NADPH:quinone oxidoreductase family protein [Rhodococcus sp. IEGM 1366]MDV8071340.1 NADPH:quinone oxidoreductase family protein [Rhodococcus sp. IEGM 1366]
MKAYELSSYTGPSGLKLAETEAPQPGKDELLIEVAAIGVNFPDLLLTRGQYQLKPELPCIPGCEVAGTVLDSPPGSGWVPGDRVSAFIWKGAFAEQAVVPVATASPIADNVSFTDAAATIVNYQTVMFALDRRAKLQPGETVLVLGAAGGIGTAAVQIAKGMGARVLAGVATEEQTEVASSAGADDVITLEPGYSATVKALMGRGIDVVVDPLGDWLFDEAIRCLEPEGRVVVVGFAAGQIPTVAVNRLLLRNVAVIGAAFGAFLDREPELVATQARRIAEFTDAGTVAPQIDGVYKFAELPHALERLGRGEVRGKAVVSMERE